MFLAAVNDTPYRIVLILHILSAMAAFAPAFVHPVLMNQSKALDDRGHRGVVGYLSANGRRIYAPALIVTGLLGFALQGMSDGTWDFGQAWFLIAVIIWIAMNGVLHGMQIPSERRISQGDGGAQRLAEIASAIILVLLLIMVIIMVFKPGV